jgi:hypothetical protein
MSQENVEIVRGAIGREMLTLQMSAAVTSRGLR